MSNNIEYKWTIQDVQTIGIFMREVEIALKVIAICLVVLTTISFCVFSYWVFL